MTFEINQVITWRESPQAWFGTGKVAQVSEDGQFVKFGFVRHWVKVEDCEPCSNQSAIAFWNRYRDL